jgi:uncharacterized protein YbaP (TraB family)
MRWLTTLVLAIALAVIGCTSSRPTCALPEYPVAGRGGPFLWRVQRDVGPVVWFYGTIHSTGTESVPRVAWTALERSPHFASELGDVEPDPERVRELIRLPPGKGLDQQLSTDDWYDLRDALVGVIREDDLKRARPWFALTRLTSAAAPPPDPSMDVALARRAKARGIPVDALESWNEQLTALAQNVTVKDLEEAIHSRHELACELSKMKASYQAGDQPTMQKVLVIPAIKNLLEDRNKQWLPKLERYFQDGGAFIAVGLGHLLGDGSLLAMLAAKGYTVQRVTL